MHCVAGATIITLQILGGRLEIPSDLDFGVITRFLK
jgi:hypothetical protein